jgi:hypothetical protein
VIADAAGALLRDLARRLGHEPERRDGEREDGGQGHDA